MRGIAAVMQEIATNVRADATKISFCSGVVRRGGMLGFIAVVVLIFRNVFVCLV